MDKWTDDDWSGQWYKDGKSQRNAKTANWEPGSLINQLDGMIAKIYVPWCSDPSRWRQNVSSIFLLQHLQAVTKHRDRYMHTTSSLTDVRLLYIMHNTTPSVVLGCSARAHLRMFTDSLRWLSVRVFPSLLLRENFAHTRKAYMPRNMLHIMKNVIDCFIRNGLGLPLKGLSAPCLPHHFC